jgi:hypothetical protein
MNYQQVYTMECYKRMNLSHNPMSKVQYIHIDLLELNILDLLCLYHIERTMNIKHCQDQLYMKKIVSGVNLIWWKEIIS